MNVQITQALEKMSSVEKYFRTAPYLRCGEILKGPTNEVLSMGYDRNSKLVPCNCEGWKNPALFMNDANNVMKEDEMHNCAVCKHKITTHGNLNTIKRI